MTPYKGFEKDVLAFNRRVVGTLIRHQRVMAVEITIDTLDEPCRWFIRVLFQENPVQDISPEHNMLERIFSEIPDHAWCKPKDASELRAILRGKKAPAWVLSDEMPDQVERAVQA